MAANPNAQKLAELAALVEVVKERVRTQYPETTANGSSGTVCVGLPDLTPLARARDAAAGKMAAIGTVNPRHGGVVNNSVQAVKRLIARSLNWFVRDQVLFNRQTISCVEIAIETLNDINRTIHVLAGQANSEIQKVRTEVEPLRREAQILRTKTSDFVDLVSHWNRWREEWQLKLHNNEVEFLKSVADLNTVVQQKVFHAEAATEYRCAQVEAALGRFTADLSARHQQQAAALDAGFAKSSADLAESYRQIALRLEAACQATAHRIEENFNGVVVPLESGFRQTVTNLEESYHATLSQTEASFRETITQVEASFEKRVAALEAAYEAQVAQFDQRAARSELAFRELANANAEEMQAAAASQISALARESHETLSALDQRMVASIGELQKKFYSDLDRIRTEYERVIHAELRVVRQRLAPGAPSIAPAPAMEAAAPLSFDYSRFADRFRGSEEYVAESQRFYLPYFTGRRHVLDIGCGRGEFLKLMRDNGVPAKGIESSGESAAHCRSLGLDVEQADLFAYLAAQPEGTLDGIFCSQVVEHLPPARLPEMMRLCATRLATGGVLAIETPNPECLAIFATHFYLDPTHTRPVPSQLLAFYMEESGMGRVEVHPKAAAIESMPEVGELPAGFREKFFGGLDYAILGYRL